MARSRRRFWAPVGEEMAVKRLRRVSRMSIGILGRDNSASAPFCQLIDGRQSSSQYRRTCRMRRSRKCSSQARFCVSTGYEGFNGISVREEGPAVYERV
jgi:hypothetical protein